MKKYKNKYILTIILLVIILLAIVSFSLVKNGHRQTIEVTLKDFVQKIEVSGKVIPSQEIDLSFEVGGKVDQVFVKIGDVVQTGDILARLNKAEIDGEMGEALAGLDSENAKLSEIKGAGGDQNEITSIKESLLNTLNKSYVSSDNVIKNTVDTFFSDSDQRTPSFSITLSNYFLRKKIEESRYLIGKMLKNWEIQISALDSRNISLSDAENSIEKLRQIESLLALISSGVDDFTENNNTTQGQIDAYISNIGQTRTIIASAIVDINTATEKVRNVEAEVPIILASVKNAQATISKLSAKKDKYSIVAPFDGIITDDNLEVGEVISANNIVISMISNQPLEIESFIPEISIAGINIGDSAVLTLDAFSKYETYTARVTHIDPRESIKDGITTYRILLEFNDSNPKILSGMSADIEITKEKIENQIVVPRYLLIQKGDDYFAIVDKGGVVVEVRVELGQVDNSGNVIILSGLLGGETLVIPE